MRIRPERPADVAGIRNVNLAAFESPAEADLVDRLREQVRPFVSLVADAEDDGHVVGHILFTPVTLSSAPDLSVMGLAPMAVWPTHQRQGVGSALVRAGLDECRRLGTDAIVVLGHAEYYPRFGFVPALSRFGIRSEYAAEDGEFLALELRAGTLRDHAGLVRYHAAFAGV